MREAVEGRLKELKAKRATAQQQFEQANEIRGRAAVAIQQLDGAIATLAELLDKPDELQKVNKGPKSKRARTKK